MLTSAKMFLKITSTSEWSGKGVRMLIQIAFVVIPAFVALYVAFSLFRRRVKNVPIALCVCVIGGFLAVVSSFRLVSQWHNHNLLRELSAAGVDSIVVGSRELSSTEEIGPFVAALNDVRWFSPHRAAIGDNSVSLLVRLQNGKSLEYHVVRHLQRPGAIIYFDTADANRLPFGSGAGFVPQLDQLVTLYLPGHRSL